MTVLTLITLTGHKRGESEPFTQSHSVPINVFGSLPLEIAVSNDWNILGPHTSPQVSITSLSPQNYFNVNCKSSCIYEKLGLSSFCCSAITKNNKGSASSSASLCWEGGLPSWEIVQMLDMGYTWFEYLLLCVSKKTFAVWTWSTSGWQCCTDNCKSMCTYLCIYIYGDRERERERLVDGLIDSFIHPFVHSFIHSLMDSFVHSFIHSFIHSLMDSFIHSFIHSFSQSFIHSFSQSVIHSFSHSFIHSVIHSFIHWCIHWLIVGPHMDHISRWWS